MDVRSFGNQLFIYCWELVHYVLFRTYGGNWISRKKCTRCWLCYGHIKHVHFVCLFVCLLGCLFVCWGLFVCLLGCLFVCFFVCMAQTVSGKLKHPTVTTRNNPWGITSGQWPMVMVLSRCRAHVIKIIREGPFRH